MGRCTQWLSYGAVGFRSARCQPPSRPGVRERTGGAPMAQAATATPAEDRAMVRALEIAATGGVPLGPKPHVDCVLLADDAPEVAEGFPRGAIGRAWGRDSGWKNV